MAKDSNFPKSPKDFKVPRVGMSLCTSRHTLNPNPTEFSRRNNQEQTKFT